MLAWTSNHSARSTTVGVTCTSGASRHPGARLWQAIDTPLEPKCTRTRRSGSVWVGEALMRATTDRSGSVRGEEASTPASRSRTYGRRHLMASRRACPRCRRRVHRCGPLRWGRLQVRAEDFWQPRRVIVRWLQTGELSGRYATAAALIRAEPVLQRPCRRRPTPACSITAQTTP